MKDNNFINFLKLCGFPPDYIELAREIQEKEEREMQTNEESDSN